MHKDKGSTKLYRFIRHQKNKHSASTKDLNDSLDSPPHQLPQGKLHTRTHSCPSVEPSAPPLIERPVHETARTNQIKLGHRNCRSQVDLDRFSTNQPSLSIDNISSKLYRKSSGQTVLKKSRVSGGRKFKPFTVGREQYERVRVDQQIKQYELREELKQLQSKSKGITMKQDILESLLKKFNRDALLISSQSFIQS